MDFLKNVTGNNKEGEQKHHQTKPAAESQGEGMFGKLSGFAGSKKPEEAQRKEEGGGFMDKINSLAGGGRESEKNEDALDKAVDMFQERVLKQGTQDNESALEQAKDEQISDAIRDSYKRVTGSELPIADKKH